MDVQGSPGRLGGMRTTHVYGSSTLRWHGSRRGALTMPTARLFLVHYDGYALPEFSKKTLIFPCCANFHVLSGCSCSSGMSRSSMGKQGRAVWTENGLI